MTAFRYVDSQTLGRGDDESRFRAWQVNLDRIELDVMRAERALEQGAQLSVSPWDLPGHYGPLPAELRDRAEEILERQHRVIERIASTLGHTLRQRDLVDAVGRTSPSDRRYPVYVDVSA